MKLKRGTLRFRGISPRNTDGLYTVFASDETGEGTTFAIRIKNLTREEALLARIYTDVTGHDYNVAKEFVLNFSSKVRAIFWKNVGQKWRSVPDDMVFWSDNYQGVRPLPSHADQVESIDDLRKKVKIGKLPVPLSERIVRNG